MDDRNTSPEVISEYSRIAIAKLIIMYVVLIVIGLSAFTYSVIGGGFVLALVAFKIWYDDPMKDMTINAENIVIRYWFSGSEVLEYLNIKAIHTKRATSGRAGRVSSTQSQEIELFNSDDTIVYNEDEFINYEQMKMAIWNYRLAAFQAQRDGIQQTQTDIN
jgi:hypothetical protein